jgi:predicted transcriptional regulator
VALQPVGRVALMSIHPVHAGAILRGDKKVEFRKRPLAADITHVLVYATAPVFAVVGAFTVAGQHTSSPASLWKRFRQDAGIPRLKFFDYYGSSAKGTGIKVGMVLAPRQPLNLKSSLGVRRPPQSFQYLTAETAQSALDAMSPGWAYSLSLQIQRLL